MTAKYQANLRDRTVSRMRNLQGDPNGRWAGMSMDKVVNELLLISLDAIEDGEKMKRDLAYRSLTLFPAEVDSLDNSPAIAQFHGTDIPAKLDG
jgi:hypothetical protein